MVLLIKIFPGAEGASSAYNTLKKCQLLYHVIMLPPTFGPLPEGLCSAPGKGRRVPGSFSHRQREV